MSQSPRAYMEVQANIFHREPILEGPEQKRRHRLTHRRGDAFTPHGTDAVGIIISHPLRNRRTVEFRYTHDRDTLHTMPIHEFTDRFARILPRAPRRTPAPLAQTRKKTA